MDEVFDRHVKIPTNCLWRWLHIYCRLMYDWNIGDCDVKQQINSNTNSIIHSRLLINFTYECNVPDPGGHFTVFVPSNYAFATNGISLLRARNTTHVEGESVSIVLHLYDAFTTFYIIRNTNKDIEQVFWVYQKYLHNVSGPETSSHLHLHVVG